MTRAVLLVLLALLLAWPPPLDLGGSGVPAWEAADDTVATAALEDGGVAPSFSAVDAPSRLIATIAPVAPSTRRAPSLPPAPGRAPPSA